MTIVGTRPEVIKLSAIIKQCDKYFDHILVHTGQNHAYTLNKIFFEDLQLREPDYYLEVVGDSLGKTIGNIIEKSYDLMLSVKPDALLILGDTNSALSAISAKRLKIPIFHMEAGNRCFDDNLPEEVNRRIIDHIADINLPYTEHARRNLIDEGIRKEHIFVTGSPMAEILNAYHNDIIGSKVVSKLGLKKGGYILVSAHREENIDIETNFYELMDSINKISISYSKPVIYSLHPRSAKFIAQRKYKLSKNVKQMDPFGFVEYNNLQLNAFCVVSDSGTLAEESAILNFPAVSIRTSTERPEAIDKGGFIIGGIRSNEVLSAVDLVTNMFDNMVNHSSVPDYSDLNVSSNILKIIQSYTGIINKVVWNK